MYIYAHCMLVTFLRAFIHRGTLWYVCLEERMKYLRCPHKHSHAGSMRRISCSQATHQATQATNGTSTWNWMLWGKMMPAMGEDDASHASHARNTKMLRHSLDLYRYYWRHAIIRTYILLKKLVWLGCISEGFLCGSHQPKVLISPDVSAAHCCLHQW